MANSIFKWCKTKFMNGYKHINVEAGGDFGGCRSDTETLVRGSEEEFVLRTPIPPTPTLTVREEPHAHPQFTPDVHDQRGQRPARNTATYVEEVTYDVSLSSGDIDKQEFAFTLYDFDGHGKITKDDISSLVQTIYEAVGSSLSLPPCGSRTIRVKLTVVPEVTSSPSLERQGDLLKDSPRSLQEPSSSPLYTPRGIDEVEVASTPGRSPREDGELEDLSSSRRVRRRRGRRRTSLHRQELLQIIQANMEKNNLFYPPFHQRNYPSRHHLHHNHRRRRRYHCSCHCSSTVNPTQLKPQLTPCKGSTDCCDCHRVSHYRSKSHDFTTDSPHVFRQNLLDNTSQPLLPPSNTPDRPTSPKTIHQHHHNHLHPKIMYHKRSRSCESSDSEEILFPEVEGKDLGLANLKEVCDTIHGSPNQNTKHKHHHRHEEHARAMSQVVSWLQRSSFKDRKGNKHGQELKTLDTLNSSPAAINSEVNGTCGHSHHVHQHYHHHYHHYPSTPPLII